MHVFCSNLFAHSASFSRSYCHLQREATPHSQFKVRNWLLSRTKYIDLPLDTSMKTGSISHKSWGGGVNDDGLNQSICTYPTIVLHFDIFLNLRSLWKQKIRVYEAALSLNLWQYFSEMFVFVTEIQTSWKDRLLNVYKQNRGVSVDCKYNT